MRAATSVIIILVWITSSVISAAWRLDRHASAIVEFSGQTGKETTVVCDARSYMIDHDPAGTNVRSGPGKSFKIIGNLPNQGVEGIGVHITGSNGEWVRIDHAVEEGADQERVFFPIAPITAAPAQGWIHSSLLGASGMAITKGGTNLYRQPKKNSGVVTRIPGGDDSVVVHGCRGGWIYVEYKKLKGWAAPDTLCANSLTTCN